jgi:hypothetical protein
MKKNKSVDKQVSKLPARQSLMRTPNKGRKSMVGRNMVHMMGSSRDDSSFGTGTVLELREHLNNQLENMKPVDINTMFKECSD